ncbi:MAG TPA: nuclear transport factor 2 family protein [Verrucomicrobiae bacterium]|nr:nuclear transport factor 2 family protein [Verrucomicrobiae bacterium]
MSPFRTTAALAALLLAGCTTAPVDRAALERQVAQAERDFARSMAERDHAAFTGLLAEDTVFFSPKATRGKAAVSAAWKRFFDGPLAPFSWEPAEVEVLDGGDLALTSGPVRDPRGEVVGSFTSIWRLEAPGRWRIIFDKGCDVCPVRK